MSNFSPIRNTTSVAPLALAEAEAFFSRLASPQDKAVFPNGIEDLCDRAFGLYLDRRLIGVATLRDARQYWEKLSKILPMINHKTALDSLVHMGIYEPAALTQAPVEKLRQALKQLAWISLGGNRGFQGEASGTELFGRFIEPRFRDKGHGLKLLDNVLAILEAEGKLPLRATPTSKKDRTYGGRISEKRLVILNQDYFRAKLTS